MKVSLTGLNKHAKGRVVIAYSVNKYILNTYSYAVWSLCYWRLCCSKIVN